MGDVVDDRAALAEHSDHELRRRGAVAAVVRPEKRVIVVELHVAKTRHGGHRRIGCAGGEPLSERIGYRFTGGISGFFTHSVISSTVSLNNC